MRALVLISVASLTISSAAEFTARKLPVPTEGKTGFTLLSPADTKVNFTNSLADTSAEKNRILENGSGVALGDIDGDGLCDIYLCALERPNALFRNLGNWKFVEMPNAGGASCAGQISTGVVFADIDADGDLDLLVNGLAAGTRLFRNDGKGQFTEDTGSGLDRRSAATSMALADIEGDGDLDLFVVTYRSNTLRDGVTPGFEVTQVNGKLVVKPEDQFEVNETPGGPQIVEKADADFLYLNDGAGKFSAASWTDGRFLDEDDKPLKSAPRRWGLAAMFHDLNNDAAPDLYICNDFIDSPDELWINDGKGKFRAIARLALRHTSWSSMAVDVADINRDGHMDFFVADMLSPNNVRRQTQKANLELSAIRIRPGEIDNRPQNFQNTLQLNWGDATFTEIANLAGVAATDWTWSAIFLDVDLDGWEDLLVTTGNNHDIQDADTATRLGPVLNTPPHLRKPVLLEYPRLETPSRVYRNNCNLTFTDLSKEWGFDRVGISQGMAVGDLDNDGDLDVVVNNLHAAASVYRNESSAPRLAVRLRGRGSIGARIEVKSSGNAQTQEMISGGRYLSGDESVRTFAALGPSDVMVRWRNGAITRTEKVSENQLLEFSEPPNIASIPIAAPEEVETWFEDVSQRLNHVHREALYDDWAGQPLLPNRFAQMGPAICVADLDRDGWEDLVIGGGRGETPAFFKNDQRGGFTAFKSKVSPLNGDQDAIAAIGNLVAVAASNYEGGGPAQPSVVFCGVTNGAVERLGDLPGQTSIVGALANSGSNLFVGSKFGPGRYPESAPSRIFRLSKQWELDREASAQMWARATGAQWADVDGDRELDLLIASDWDSPRVFKNGVEITKSLGLADFTGRWNCIATADFNSDGKTDFLLGNWGRNTRAQRFMSKPLKLIYGDFNGDRRLEILESFFDPDLQKYVPWRGRITVARAVPTLTERFPTFAAYGAAGTDEILQGFAYETVEAKTLDTMLFLNRGGKFEPAPLPVEVQFAPVMGITVADFNNDGKLDVFMAQNFFALHDEVTRMDGGKGLLLQGDGRGGFRAVRAQESGLAIYGEQRGCAAADFNHDGVVDLVVTQNNGPTRVFFNRKATLKQ